MDYQGVILRYAPAFWDRFDGERTELLPGSVEYRIIASQTRQAISDPGKHITSICRVQNVIDLGQLLVREQFLICLHKQTKYYRVRRFVVIRAAYLQHALQNNLDPRRCQLEDLQFNSHVSIAAGADKVMLVVQVLTAEPHQATIRPHNSLEYFIEYIVEFR